MNQFIIFPTDESQNESSVAAIDDDVMQIIKNGSPKKKVKSDVEKKQVSVSLFKPYAEFDSKSGGKNENSSYGKKLWIFTLGR